MDGIVINDVFYIFNKDIICNCNHCLLQDFCNNSHNCLCKSVNPELIDFGIFDKTINLKDKL